MTNNGSETDSLLFFLVTTLREEPEATNQKSLKDWPSTIESAGFKTDDLINFIGNERYEALWTGNEDIKSVYRSFKDSDKRTGELIEYLANQEIKWLATISEDIEDIINSQNNLLSIAGGTTKAGRIAGYSILSLSIATILGAGYLTRKRWTPYIAKLFRKQEMQEIRDIPLSPRHASEEFFGLELDSITKQQILDENIIAIKAGLNANLNQQRWLDRVEVKWLENPGQYLDELTNCAEDAFKMGPLHYLADLEKGNLIELTKLEHAYKLDQTELVHDYCKNHFHGDDDWEILSQSDKILRAQIVKDLILATIKNNTTDQRLIKGFKMISAIEQHDEAALKKAVADDEIKNLMSQINPIILESEINAMDAKLEAAFKARAAQDPIMEKAIQDFKSGLREEDPEIFAKLLSPEEMVAKMETYRQNDELRLCFHYFTNQINFVNNEKALDQALMNELENTTETGYRNWFNDQPDLAKEIMKAAGLDEDVAVTIRNRLRAAKAGTYDFEAAKKVFLERFAPEIESDAEAEMVQVIRRQSEELIVDEVAELDRMIVDGGEDALSKIVSDAESDLESLISDF